MREKVCMAGGNGKCVGFTSLCRSAQTTTGYKTRLPQHE